MKAEEIYNELKDITEGTYNFQDQMVIISKWIEYKLNNPSKTKKNPTVNDQMLVDAGLNAFGLKLFIESIANKEDVKSFKPLTFIYKDVKTTIQPVMEDK